jgi:S-adenosylmethionine synthetase
MLVGRFDFKRGTFRGEVNVSLEVNPLIQQQFKNQEKIISEQKELRKELEEIKELLKNV